MANGYGPCPATARATCAVSSGTFGHGLGCIDISTPHPRPGTSRQPLLSCPTSRQTCWVRNKPAGSVTGRKPASGPRGVGGLQHATGERAVQESDDHSGTSIRRDSPASPLGGARNRKDSTGVPATSAPAPGRRGKDAASIDEIRLLTQHQWGIRRPFDVGASPDHTVLLGADVPLAHLVHPYRPAAVVDASVVLVFGTGRLGGDLVGEPDDPDVSLRGLGRRVGVRLVSPGRHASSPRCWPTSSSTSSTTRPSACTTSEPGTAPCGAARSRCPTGCRQP